LLLWIFIPGILWILVNINSFIASWLFDKPDNPEWTYLIFDLLNRLIVGISQWIILRFQSFKITVLWGITGAIGMGIPILIYMPGRSNGMVFPDFFNYSIIFSLS
jgi:hypothetical protein